MQRDTMKIPIFTTTKVLAFLIMLLMINLPIISSNSYTEALKLSDVSMTPEIGRYWKYENRDLQLGWIFGFTLKAQTEKLIKVANQNVSVVVINGTGNIKQWPGNINKSQITDQNKIFIEKQVDNNTLELITYTLQISYVLNINDNFTTNYNYEFTTYNITESTKPQNISLGSTWSRKVIRTQSLEYRKWPGETQHITHPDELINSTFECDKIVKTMVNAGTFDTYRIVERQWIGGNPDTTIYWFYSTQTKSVVKKERRNIAQELVEVEELMDYGPKDNVPPNNNSKNNSDSDWFNLNNTNFQLFLGVIAIIIICVILGLFMPRKRKGKTKD